MSLGTLPVDGICLIADLLDLESLSRLFATLNRRIQNLLSSPNMLPLLVLKNAKMITDNRFAYYMRSIRSVKRLKVLSLSKKDYGLLDASWLARLNPIELQIDSGVLCQVLTFQQPAEVDGGDQTILKSLLLPAFQRLTSLSLNPGITQSTLQEVTRLHSSGTQLFPPTLTSISLLWASPPPQPLLEVLPTHLKSLSLSIDHAHRLFTSEWTWTLSRLIELENLTLQFIFHTSMEASQTTSDDIFMLPPTLQSLRINRVIADIGFFNVLNRMISNCPQLHTLIINATHGAVNDINGFEERPYVDITCPNLRQLTYNTKQDFQDVDVVNLSTNIYSLSISVSKHWNPLITSISRLKCLEILRLTSSSGQGFALGNRLPSPDTQDPDCPFIIDCTMLPGSIQLLGFDNLLAPTSYEIALLPSNLRSLHVTHFDLNQHPYLQKAAPMCKLHISMPVRVWSLDNADWCTSGDMAEYWSSPTFDVEAWLSALARKGRSLGIRCKFDHILSDPSAFNAPEELRFPSNLRVLKVHGTSDFLSGILSQYLAKAAQECPKIETLDLRTNDEIQISHLRGFLPRGLTHLDLNDTVIFNELPPIPGLKRLSAQRLTTVPPRLGSQLTHVDAPNWKLDWETSQHHWNIENLEMLRMTLTDVADFMVVEFLKRLTPQARLNSSLTIEYYVTGALLPESGPTATRHVTWASMIEATDVILKSQLSSLMPSNYQGASSSASNHTIGCCVASLIQAAPRQVSQIFLPRLDPLTIHLEEEHHHFNLSTEKPGLLPILATSHAFPRTLSASRPTSSVLGLSLTNTFSDENQSNLLLLNPTTQATKSNSTVPEPPSVFGLSLVLLDIKTLTAGDWLPSLPPTVKYLRFSASDDLTGVSFPPNLITLIIHCHIPTLLSLYPIPFAGSWMVPSSLEHFAITTDGSTDMSPDVNKFEALPLNLPRLKTFYFPCSLKQALETCWYRVVSPLLERFIVAGDPANFESLQQNAKVAFEPSSKRFLSEMISRMHSEGLAASAERESLI